MTLVEFLRARLDEDEQEAREAQLEDSGGANWGSGAVLISPARMLAEVEAKRRIIETFRWRWDRPTETDAELHARCAHPDYEYETTEGPRKAWDDADRPPDDDPTWERNTDMGRVGTPDAGWDRLDYTEESYWRRRLPDEQAVRRRKEQDEPPIVLALLALPYADHPDYDEAWRV